jgi:hypothetical protein
VGKTLLLSGPRNQGVTESLRYHDLPNYVPIELGQFLGRHPKLSVHATADRLNGVATYEICGDLESCDIAGATFLYVPVARDLNRVLLVRDRIEDRLLRQPGRKLALARGLDKFEFLGADRSEERYRIHAV